MNTCINVCSLHAFIVLLLRCVQVTPLQLACQEGHLKVVELLMKYGAKVSLKNNSGLNSLDVAIENGHK